MPRHAKITRDIVIMMNKRVVRMNIQTLTYTELLDHATWDHNVDTEQCVPCAAVTELARRSAEGTTEPADAKR